MVITEGIFFHSWAGIGRVALAAPLVYFSIVFFIRVFGKRSASAMNNFDWIVTVAIGSIVAAIVLQKNIAIFEGLEAIALLFTLQYLVTKLATSIPVFSETLRAEPSVLFFRGKFLEDTMRTERVTHDEVIAAIREAGQGDLNRVEAVVLESDAKISVISKNGATNTLENLSTEDVPTSLVRKA